jgi:hypothetical protein
MSTPKRPDGRSGYQALAAEARDFVEMYLSAAERPQPAAEVAMYADKVDYFSHGQLSRKAIEADQRNYYRRWPRRDFTLLEEPKVVEIRPSEVVVKFRVRYSVHNASRKAQGVTENIVRLTRVNSVLRITAIRERNIRS